MQTTFNRPGWLFIALAGLWAISGSALARDPAVGAAPNTPSETPNTPAQTEAQHKLDVRYAEVYEKIAQLDLQKGIEANRRIANTIPQTEIDRLKQVLELATEQARKARSGSNAGMALETATSQVKVAEEGFQTAVAANNRAPGSISQVELDRLRLIAELARLQLAKQKVVSETHSELNDMQQRFGKLEKEVGELREQVAQLLKQSGSMSRDSSTANSSSGKKAGLADAPRNINSSPRLERRPATANK